ncbi:MAG TPA: hypothetical protein VL426_04585 [Candidatus Binatia bacterium]|jgi:hypothetical protein|nr:hypothetical protein [Candidatus Binatia bacterium]
MKIPPALARRALPFAPLFAVVTVLALTTYVALQQSLRISANDPQIAVAEDAAAALAAGQPLSQVVPPARAVRAEASVAPFVVVYGEDRQPRTTTGTLAGATPVPPKGVFDYAKEHGEDRVTWAPRDGVRLAAVVVHYGAESGSGYVLAARSLREVEDRIENLGRLVALGWLAAVVCGAVASLAVRRFAAA